MTTATTTAIAAPDTTAFETETSPIVARANEIQVTDATSYEVGAAAMREIRTYEKRAKEIYAEPKRQANALHKTLCGLESALLKPLTTAADIIDGKMGAYRIAEQRRAAEEQERLRAEARKQEEDRRLAEVQALIDEGQEEQAEAVIAAPVATPVVHVAPAIPKVKGYAMRDNWVHKVVDVNLVPREYMMPDDAKLRAHARSMKESAKIPGVEFRNEPISAASGY